MWTTRGWHTPTGNVWCAKRDDSKRAAAVAAALELAAYVRQILLQFCEIFAVAGKYRAEKIRKPEKEAVSLY